MKNLFLIGLLVFASSKSIAQPFYLYGTEKDVREAVLNSEGKVQIVLQYLPSGSKVLKWKNNQLQQTRYVGFDSKDSASLFCIVPDNKTAMNKLVSKYNENFSKESETEWRWFIYGRIIKIEMKYEGGDKYSFYHSRIL